MRLLAAVAAGVLLAASAAAAPPSASPDAGAVGPGIRGAIALEPGRMRAGDVASLEVVVTTPPGHRLRPVVPPAEVPGLWVLDAEALPMEQEDGRWIHRTRLRLRARELGQFTWPAQAVEIEGPDGKLQRLVLEGRGIEVVSVQPEFPGRSVPFGLRDPAGSVNQPGAPWGAAAAGALLGAGAVSLVALVRRARKSRHEIASLSTDPVGPVVAPWDAAFEQLDSTEGCIDADPAAAGDALAQMLRRYATERWRHDVSAATTQELAALAPRGAAEAHWGALLACLRLLDDARFRPGVSRSTATAQVREALGQVRALVSASRPPEARR